MRLFEHSDLCALEIWHGHTSFGPLYEVSEEKLPLALIEFLHKLHSGTAETIYKADNEPLQSAQGFRSVCLTGGKSQAVFQKLSQKEFPFSIEWVESLTALSDFDVTIDWGQTSIKVYRASEKQIIPRDLVLFPIHCSVQNDFVEYSECRQKIQNQLQRLIGPNVEKTKLALALPVKINSALTAEPSTYQGLSGSLPKLFQGFALAQIEFMNDAILAARQVRELKKSISKNTLVLTIGYGVGAALWKK